MRWVRTFRSLLRRVPSALACAFAAPSAVCAAALAAGTPPVTHFTPDLDVFPQNFAVAQDAEGLVYVGNSDGVLEFDGDRWRLIRLPNREIVRSLAVGPDGTVHVGGYDSFGRLERDAAGTARYVELSQDFASTLAGRAFYDIWDTVVAPDGVYYRALRDVFFVGADGTRRHWHHAGRFGAVAVHDTEVLLQFRGEGFRRRAGDGWEPLPGTALLDTLVPRLVPLRDGSLLAMGPGEGWHRIVDGRAQVLDPPSGLPPASRFLDALGLPGGDVVLTTFDGRLFVLSADLARVRQFRVDDGVLSSAAPAADGLLVAGDLAIHHVQWPSAWTALGPGTGLAGTVHGFARWGDTDYVLGGAGVSRVVVGGDGDVAIQRLDWNDSEAYDLIPLDARRALLATSHDLLLRSGDATSRVGEPLVYPRMFVRSRFHPGRIWVATEAGLRHVDVQGDALWLSPLANEGIDMRVTSLEELDANTLWFGTERHGVWRVALDARGQIAAQRRFGPADGLRLGAVAGAAVARPDEGPVVVTTDAGLFRLDGERFVAESLHGLDRLRAADELLRIVREPDGSLWAYGSKRILGRAPGGAWREEPVRGLLRGVFERVVRVDDGRLVVIASRALLVHEGVAGAPAEVEPPAVRLREVSWVAADGTRSPLPLRPDAPLRVPHGDHGIGFRFALPDLRQGLERRYSVRLLGYETQWSPWANSRGFVYSRLPAGEYELQVRALDADGRESSIAPWRMRVDPPWYATWWAWLLWLVGGTFALALFTRAVLRYRLRRLSAEKRALEAMVAERTRELAQANTRLGAMANLDGLTGIANRRRLDEMLATTWEQSRQRRRCVALVAIDVDHFKQYNDSKGHLAGDQLLRELPRVLAPALRRSEDLLARYGGEEFMVVLPGADLVLAQEVAEALRAAVAGSPLGVTISLGVAAWIPGPEPVDALVEAADVALYEAKRAGRNQVASSRHATPARRASA
jgi:diguanylate cyclase (GGDEF)-like protein